MNKSLVGLMTNFPVLAPQKASDSQEYINCRAIHMGVPFFLACRLVYLFRYVHICIIVCGATTGSHFTQNLLLNAQ